MGVAQACLTSGLDRFRIRDVTKVGFWIVFLAGPLVWWLSALALGSYTVLTLGLCAGAWGWFMGGFYDEVFDASQR